MTALVRIGMVGDVFIFTLYTTTLSNPVGLKVLIRFSIESEYISRHSFILNALVLICYRVHSSNLSTGT